MKDLSQFFSTCQHAAHTQHTKKFESFFNKSMRRIWSWVSCGMWWTVPRKEVSCFDVNCGRESIDVTTYRTRTDKYLLSFFINIESLFWSIFFCRWVSGNYSNSSPCCCFKKKNFFFSGRTRDQNGDHNFWCLSSSCLVSQSTFSLY
jgi:hypothetical protein